MLKDFLFLRRIASLALFAAVCAQWTSGQNICRVDEETRGFLRTISGRFSIQSFGVTVTIPARLYEGDEITVFLEAPNIDSADVPHLVMETATDRVSIAHGAKLRVVPHVHERVVFNLSTESGERLCVWLPPVLISARSPSQLADGFRQFSREYFRNAGDPIQLEIGGKLASGNGKFRIEGLDAFVLARASSVVILRDPHPSVGVRLIESQGYSIALPFVQVELQLTEPVPTANGTLKIKVLGFDLVKRRVEDSPELLLENFSENTIVVLCGRAVARDRDEHNARTIRLVGDGNGAFTATCKVKFRGEARANIVGRVLENYARGRGPLFRHP